MTEGMKWDEFVREIEAEAEAGSPEAMAELEALRAAAGESPDALARAMRRVEVARIMRRAETAVNGEIFGDPAAADLFRSEGIEHISINVVFFEDDDA